MESEDIFEWVTDECEIAHCDGKYEYEMNGGGTCTKCGHKIPCF